MVSSLSEVRAFRNVLERVSNDLKSEQVAFDESIPVGVMVEVPSVALMAESYAREVDFFSIGTNDLTQYVLAVDRGNDMVADLYHEIHPAVLRLMKITIDAGKKYGIPVALCGEMGSNSAFVPLLIGLGLEEISASPVYLPEVKRVVRALTHAEARELAELALAAPDARAVNEILKDWLEAHPLDLLHFLERNNSSSNERIA